MMKIRHRNGIPISKHKILQLFIILLLFQFLLFCWCCQTDHGEHTKSKPAKLLTVSRQEKPREWIAVKLVKREFKSLTYFPSKPSCYIVDCNLYATTFVQTQCTCKQPAFCLRWKERDCPSHLLEAFGLSLICTWLSTIANPIFANFPFSIKILWM